MWSAGVTIDDVARCVHNTLAGYWSGGTDAITSVTLAQSTGVLASGIIELSELALHEVADIGSTYGECTLLARTEASGESFLDFTISGNYQRYVLVLLGVVLDTDATDLNGRVGTAGGIKESGYKRHMNLSDSSSSSYSGSTGIIRVNYANALGNAAGENFCQVVEVPNPADQYKIVSAQGAYVDSGGDARMCNGAGAWTGGTDQLTTYRILPSSPATMSGTILWFGIN